MYRFFVSAVLSFALIGCMQRPADLERNLDEYELLAVLAAQELKPGQIHNREEVTSSLSMLMSNLDIHRVRYDISGAYVALSGSSNIFVGQFSYIYKLGDKEVHLEDGPTIQRTQITERWYSEEATW